MNNEQIIKAIKGDGYISQAISEAAQENPDERWGVCEIHEVVSDALGFDLDLDDVELFGELLIYFNGGIFAKWYEEVCCWASNFNIKNELNEAMFYSSFLKGTQPGNAFMDLFPEFRGTA